MARLPRDRALTIICASGYRSSIANGVLEREGFKNTTIISGGTAAWTEAGYEVNTADLLMTVKNKSPK